ncbi:hypothetical protein QEQ_2983 [Clostridioides difficile CD144]|nr:hypothetical protein QEQ_2983 [Clostridioides difficile CD144]
MISFLYRILSLNLIQQNIVTLSSMIIILNKATIIYFL